MTAEFVTLISHLTLTPNYEAYLLNYWKWRKEFSVTVSFSGKTKHYRVHIDFPILPPNDKFPDLLNEVKRLFKEKKTDRALALVSCWTMAHHLRQTREHIDYNFSTSNLTATLTLHKRSKAEKYRQIFVAEVTPLL